MIKFKFATALMVAITSVIWLPAAAQLQGSLTVRVQNLRDRSGKVCIKVFSGQRGFPNGDDSQVSKRCVNVMEAEGKPTAIAKFTTLSPGSYAIAVFHDSNSNGKLDRGMLGIPKEGFGFSNNAQPKLTGPPEFRDAVIIVGRATKANISIRYSAF